MMRVELPYHLRTLARVAGEVSLDVQPGATFGTVVTLIEELHPTLKGTIRDPATGQRRPFLRFFAGGKDLSHAGMEAALPDEVAAGREVLIVLGAVAGG